MSTPTPILVEVYEKLHSLNIPCEHTGYEDSITSTNRDSWSIVDFNNALYFCHPTNHWWCPVFLDKISYYYNETEQLYSAVIAFIERMETSRKYSPYYKAYIDHFATFKEDYDSYGSKPITSEQVTLCKKFLDIFFANNLYRNNYDIHTTYIGGSYREMEISVYHTNEAKGIRKCWTFCITHTNDIRITCFINDFEKSNGGFDTEYSIKDLDKTINHFKKFENWLNDNSDYDNFLQNI